MLKKKKKKAKGADSSQDRQSTSGTSCFKGKLDNFMKKKSVES